MPQFEAFGSDVGGYFESNCTVKVVQAEIADANETKFVSNVSGTQGGACLSCCKSYDGTARNADGSESKVSICTHRVCGNVCTRQVTVADLVPVPEPPSVAACVVDDTAQTMVTIVLVLILVYYFGAAVFMMTTYDKPQQIHLE